MYISIVFLVTFSLLTLVYLYYSLTMIIIKNKNNNK